MRGIEGQFALDAGAAMARARRIQPERQGIYLHPQGRGHPALGRRHLIRNVADWKATGSATINRPVSATVTVRYNGDRLDTDNSQGKIFTNGMGGLFTYDRFTTVDFSGRWRITPKDTPASKSRTRSTSTITRRRTTPCPGTIYARYVRSL